MKRPVKLFCVRQKDIQDTKSKNHDGKREEACAHKRVQLQNEALFMHYKQPAPLPCEKKSSGFPSHSRHSRADHTLAE